MFREILKRWFRSMKYMKDILIYELKLVINVEYNDYLCTNIAS